MGTTTESVVVDVRDERSRDAAIIEMMTEHGLGVNAATKRYIELRKEAGLHVGVVSRKDDALKLLEGIEVVDLATWVTKLEDELEVSPGAARDYIKAHCKATGATVRSASSSEAILEWMAERAPRTNDDAEWAEFEAEFMHYMKTGFDKPKSPSNINEYRKAIRFHRMMVAR